MAPTPTSVLTINGGSSSVKFAVYQTGRIAEASVIRSDRIGLRGMTLSWQTTDGQSDEVRQELQQGVQGVGRLIDPRTKNR
jgi:acetate kinase